MATRTHRRPNGHQPVEPPPQVTPAIEPAVPPVVAGSVTSDTEEELCFICADAINWYAVGECNHTVCHLCSLRLRALYKQRTCAYCKTELSAVVYTQDGSKTFQDFDLKTMRFFDKRLGIFFDDPEIYEDVMILLRFNCPDANCDTACQDGWKELKDHVRKTHHMLMCELCVRHKKLFTHEHTLYNKSTLERHNRLGDPEDASFKGHPSCGFCRVNFYGQDELYEHCRAKHEQCFLCQRNGIHNQYFSAYPELEKHLHTDHYACKEPECLEKKFVVFNSDIDLKAHEMEEHHRDQRSRGKGQSIELNFQYAGGPSRERERRTNGGARRAERRDEQTSAPPPQQQTQPVVAAAAAAPTPAAAEAENNNNRRLRPPPGFGSRLTEETPTAKSAPGSPRPTSAQAAAPTPAQAAASSARPSTPQQQGSTTTPSGSPSSSDPELLTKLRTLFKSNATKLGEFKSLSASFRRNILTADELLTAFLGMATDNVPTKAKKEAENEAGKMWRRLAETAPEDPNPAPGQKSRKDAMMRAWNDHKARVANDESNVPRPAGNSYASSAAQPASSAAKPSAARVLVIKSNASKQRSQHGTRAIPSASTTQQQNVWERVARNMHRAEIAAQEATARLEDMPVTFAHSLTEGRSLVIDDSNSDAFPGLAPVVPGWSPALSKSNKSKAVSSSSSGSLTASKATPAAPPPSSGPAPLSMGFTTPPHPDVSWGLAKSEHVNTSKGARAAVSKDEFPGLPTRAAKAAPAPGVRLNGRIGAAMPAAPTRNGSNGDVSSQQQQQATSKKEKKKGKVTLLHFG
ncbi:hypothetical protein DFS34DRAFT_696181 [Phlyctochytrium arcticum]|nr:hypothetical protein DFS34DRAFT_696181 [Phlyctochytrium arcticum]